MWQAIDDQADAYIWALEQTFESSMSMIILQISIFIVGIEKGEADSAIRNPSLH